MHDVFGLSVHIKLTTRTSSPGKKRCHEFHYTESQLLMLARGCWLIYSVDIPDIQYA